MTIFCVVRSRLATCTVTLLLHNTMGTFAAATKSHATQQRRCCRYITMDNITPVSQHLLTLPTRIYTPANCVRPRMMVVVYLCTRVACVVNGKSVAKRHFMEMMSRIAGGLFS